MRHIHVRQQRHVLGRVAGTIAPSAALPASHRASGYVLRDQPSDLRAAQTRHLGDVLFHQTLVVPRQVRILLSTQRPLRPFIRLLPIRRLESNFFIAFQKSLDLFQAQTLPVGHADDQFSASLVPFRLTRR